MKAVVVNPEGTGVEIVANKDMRPLETGEALVQIEYCGVCTLTCTFAQPDGEKFLGVFKTPQKGPFFKNPPGGVLKNPGVFPPFGEKGAPKNFRKFGIPGV